MTDLRKDRAARADLKVPCWVCGLEEPLLTAEDHHVRPRAFGGTDEEGNRRWLCPSCHARLHRVQEFLIQGKPGEGYGLCSNIFPQNAKARGRLWTLANEAADAERETKEVFGGHRSHTKVTLNMEAEAWAILKAEAKGRRMGAAKYAAMLLQQIARGER